MLLNMLKNFGPELKYLKENTLIEMFKAMSFNVVNKYHPFIRKDFEDFCRYFSNLIGN